MNPIQSIAERVVYGTSTIQVDFWYVLGGHAKCVRVSAQHVILGRYACGFEHKREEKSNFQSKLRKRSLEDTSDGNSGHSDGWSSEARSHRTGSGLVNESMKQAVNRGRKSILILSVEGQVLV